MAGAIHVTVEPLLSIHVIGKFAVITIAIDITTIVVAVISSIVSVVASGLITWYFSRRHYTRVSRPVTENDIKLQSGKHEFYFAVLSIVFVMGGVFGFLFLIVLTS